MDSSRSACRKDAAPAIGFVAYAAGVAEGTCEPTIADRRPLRGAEQAKAQLDHDREQARLADERSLRDGKRERLHGDYVALGYAADNVLSAAKQLGGTDRRWARAPRRSVAIQA
jgi:hypothetical protein